MSVLAFARTGTPARKQVEARDRGVCARCRMDTEYVKFLCGPYLAEACRWQEAGGHEKASLLRLIVVGFLVELGFSSAVAGQAIHKYGGVINTHLWEANHIVPVVHGGGGSTEEEQLQGRFGLDDYVGVWSVFDDGDVPARFTIGGPNLLLKDGRGITIDAKNKDVIVSDKTLNAVLTFHVPEAF